MRKIPGILVCDSGTGNLEVAGLTVLDRLVVTMHRAGCTPITIVSEEAQTLARAQALEIATVSAAEIPKSNERALLITGGILLEQRDLERVIEANGHLVAADGSSLPVSVNAPQSSPILASGATTLITDASSARGAERKLWDSLSSSAEGIVDRYFNRPIGRLLSKILIHTPITPNQVSVASILMGVASAPLFAAGHFVLGAMLLQLSAIVDCVDGDLARVLFKSSRLGHWLDFGGDQLVHVSVFIALGLGVARTSAAVPALALGISAAVGVLICLFLVVRTLRLPPTQRPPLVQKLIEVTANRDFSILLLVLALLGKMELFLWLAGVGIHLFWLALLLLQATAGGGVAAISRKSA